MKSKKSLAAQKIKSTITSKDAGFGAFCNMCQPEENKLMRFMHHLQCVIVRIENQYGKYTMFLCEKCVKLVKDKYDKPNKEVELIVE